MRIIPCSGNYCAQGRGAPSGKRGYDSRPVGTFDAFKETIRGRGHRAFRRGWAWRVVNGGRLTASSTANQDNPIMGKATPARKADPSWASTSGTLLYLKYQNRRPIISIVLERC